jgi:DNA-binding LytR/AlgR family response regulator
MKLTVITHTGSNYLVLRNNKGVHRLYFNEMLFLEGSENHTDFNTSYRTVGAGYCLNHFAPMLPPNFMRVHQSFIINLKSFDCYDSNDGFIYLKANKEIKIPLGCTYEEAFFAWLNTL